MSGHTSQLHVDLRIHLGLVLLPLLAMAMPQCSVLDRIARSGGAGARCNVVAPIAACSNTLCSAAPDHRASAKVIANVRSVMTRANLFGGLFGGGGDGQAKPQEPRKQVWALLFRWRCCCCRSLLHQ